eukprot:TRINITY_DN62497_c0_g1_i1.p1 TRINITY_DN62497_c0_g1~~TRINITY_DN62497_c0_g1_i1.p1  ORF type:complete len:309 (-),score=29.44 TRINITY_DN62497_c0_g1_i1:319-1206(-)
MASTRFRLLKQVGMRRARCKPLANTFSGQSPWTLVGDKAFCGVRRLRFSLTPLRHNAHAAYPVATVIADGGLVLWLTMFGIGGAAASYYSTPLLLGRAIESYIEKMDRQLLGLDIEICNLRVYPLSGVFHYKSFKIINPPGYRQECAMSAEKLILDFDMRKLWASKGEQVDVTSVRLEGVCFYLEYSEEQGGTSNLQVVNDIVNAPAQAPASNGNEDFARAWHFYKVVLTKPTIVYGAPGSESRFELGDVAYKDFDEQVGSFALDDCIHWVLSSVMKEIQGNLSSFSFSEWLRSG